jgi:pterin-4a-carbinolamine dehydratase
MGGLGNQLFQIFTLISTSITSKIPFYFEYIENPDRVDRPFYWKNMLKRLSIFIKKDINVKLIYKEPHFHYKSIPHEIFKNENIKLFGYFQSYKYFETHKESICKMIDLKNIQDNIKQKFDNNFFTNTISLHFRIGDYANIQQHHPVLKIEYYINSLNNLIKDTQKNDWNILCFFEEQNENEVNDKINILKNNFPELTFQKIDNNLSDWEQMITMSLCQHNIIANSSFSWWGAYLNNNDNNVYYPDVWFGPAQENKIITYIFPNEWIKINI